jgi:hypothetical protein
MSPLAMYAAIGVLVIALPAHASDLRPTFASEVGAPEANAVLPLLKVVCREGVRTVTAKGRPALGCGDGSMEEILASRNRQRRDPWMPYVLWEADSILFGHFLSGTSEDVVIGCSGCEGHPNLFGGTLLLTKKLGEWTPVWYKPGVIVRHCRRVPLASGRQILFCEETDGGMGHSVHGLYTLDLTKPQFAWHSVVLMTDTYDSPMYGGVQTQFIEHVSFEEKVDSGLLVRVYVRHGRIKVRPDDQRFEEALPKPKISKYEIDFRLEGEGFKITPETAASGKLFGVR